MPFGKEVLKGLGKGIGALGRYGDIMEQRRQQQEEEAYRNEMLKLQQRQSERADEQLDFDVAKTEANASRLSMLDDMMAGQQQQLYIDKTNEDVQSQLQLGVESPHDQRMDEIRYEDELRGNRERGTIIETGKQRRLTEQGKADIATDMGKNLTFYELTDLMTNNPVVFERIGGYKLLEQFIPPEQIEEMKYMRWLSDPMKQQEEEERIRRQSLKSQRVRSKSLKRIPLAPRG